ncbi:hypothetical protein [Rhodococcus sp. WY5]|nr:hypothetical protein [Rhodococcus sp. WY5]
MAARTLFELADVRGSDAFEPWNPIFRKRAESLDAAAMEPGFFIHAQPN